MLKPTFILFAAINTILPLFISQGLSTYLPMTNQQYALLKSFSLLFLGMFLSSLATLNFSLAFLVGLFAAPLTYVSPLPSRPIIRTIVTVLLNLFSPTMVFAAAVALAGKEIGGMKLGQGGMSLGEVLKEAAFGWDVWGMNTQVVVWCVWWPAWIVGGILVWGRPRNERSENSEVKSSNLAKA
jgi:glycosylphosphatidylinositol transamidase